MRRIGLLTALLVLVATTVSADWCVDCRSESCGYFQPNGDYVVTIAPQCGQRPMEDERGYGDCRNVSNCGGCMGWTCIIRTPEPTPQSLVLGKAVVRVIPREVASPTRNQSPGV